MFELGEVKILSATLVNGNLEVVYKKDSGMVLSSYPAQHGPDRVWKNVFGAVDGGDVGLIEQIEGVHVLEVREERIEFPDKEDKESNV